MISSRVRLIPLILVAVALAILLPQAVGAQAGSNCCSCSFNGTNCSACCYSFQAPVCAVESSGSVLYCACSCTGGGGGGVGCSIRLDSRTTVMGGLDRGADRGAKIADHQLQYGLLNSGERRDGTFNFEEWALVSSAGIVLRASNVEFADRVQSDVESFRPRGKRASTVLVIEDADHPHNSREIAVPAVAPIDIDAGLPVSLAGREMWFRAEIGKDRVVDQVVLLNIPDELVSGAGLVSGSLNDRVREKLSLRYADERQHRVVVFGLMRVNAKGHLVMTSSRVILPKCCCYGVHCV